MMLKHIIRILKHKFFVLVIGVQLGGIPIWRLLIHDLSKFHPIEFKAYSKKVAGLPVADEDMNRSWLHHQKNNPHHWEYWITITAHDTVRERVKDMTPLPMPRWATREMVVDWVCATRVYSGKWPSQNHWEWFDKSFHRVVVCSKTEADIRIALIEVLGIVPKMKVTAQKESES